MTRRSLLAAALSNGLKAEAVAYDVETIRSPHQSTDTFFRSARPKGKTSTDRTLLVLPVVANISAEWGDGFLEALKLNWPERYSMTVAAPSFPHLPWYANHPANPRIAQEQFLLEAILPRCTGKVLLLGFSKSGNGAFSLLLRHPDRFAAAAAWDAPMLLDAPGKYGSADIYGTAANFAAYHIPSLLAASASHLKKPRLALSGHGYYQADTSGLHQRMLNLGIAHEYENETKRQHHWASGWMEPAMQTLDRLTR